MSTKRNSLAIVWIKGATGCDPANSTVDQRNIVVELYGLISNLYFCIIFFFDQSHVSESRGVSPDCEGRKTKVFLSDFGYTWTNIGIYILLGRILGNHHNTSLSGL